MNIALFDFDGTITSCDTFTPFIKDIIPPRRMRWGRLLLAPYIVGYRMGLVSSSRIRQKIIKVGLKGFSKLSFHEKGLIHANSYIPTVLRSKAMKRLNWHLNAGDRVIIVSASLDVYLKPWCDQMGIELLCAELEVQDDVLTGKYLGEDCTGKEKAKRVQETVELSDYDTVYAYGDTKEDDELIALADEKYFQWEKLVVTRSD